MHTALEWMLRTLFPPEPLGAFHPVDAREILAYQYRLSRAEGVEPTGAITQLRITPRIFETSVKHSIEGEYVEVGTPKVGDLRFPERSLKITVFPVQYEGPMEPTQCHPWKRRTEDNVKHGGNKYETQC